jgi:putative Mn2+ efflux pump MntP
MALTSWTHAAPRPSTGPIAVFAGAIVLSAAVLMAAAGVSWPELALPATVMLLFGFSAATAAFAWFTGEPRRVPGLGYWDIAGALLLIGIALSVLVEPGQLARLAG